MGSEKRLYILDTNVLMHDPTALFRFEEHDIFLPMMVLEELDAAKKGLSEVARNVRQVSRFIDEMMQRQEITNLDDGLDLIVPDGIDLAKARASCSSRLPCRKLTPVCSGMDRSLTMKY